MKRKQKTMFSISISEDGLDALDRRIKKQNMLRKKNGNYKKIKRSAFVRALIEKELNAGY